SRARSSQASTHTRTSRQRSSPRSAATRSRCPTKSPEKKTAQEARSIKTVAGLKIYHICGCNLLKDQRCDLKGEWEERMDRALLGSFKRLPLVTSALSGA